MATGTPDVRAASEAFSPAYLAGRLTRLPSMRGYRVAISGGADSLALLHALCQLRKVLAPATISAVHVHHGLHACADAWQAACSGLCEALGIAMELRRVDARAGRGESPEAAARRARYEVLAALVGPGEVLCTAHHQRDQAETLLLQLVRGGGPAGLAAMPALAPFGEGWLARPLLDVTPAALREYLLRAGVPWTEDPGNADQRFDRNFVRHEILPHLEQRWPGVQGTLARAARHQADSAALSQALADMDLSAAQGSLPGTLSAASLERLPAARGRNLLRRWLAGRGLPVANARHVQEILDQCLTARAYATPLVTWPGAEVRRYRGLLYALPTMPVHDAARAIPWVPGSVLELALGRLQATPARGRGLSVERCADARVEIRFRQGGERMRPAGRRHSTALKKLFQSSGVPPWLRDRIPLVYVDGELAAIAGLAVDEAFAVAGQGPGWLVDWTALPGGETFSAGYESNQHGLR
jgi:tRNA(Ile)-lysidine synthase